MNFSSFKYILKHSLSLSMLILSLLNNVLYAKNEPVTSIKNKKPSLLQIVFYNNSDSERTAVVMVKERIKDKGLVAVQGISINFYIQGSDSLKLFQRIQTNEKGEAKIKLIRSMSLDSAGNISVIAKIQNDSNYEDAEIYASVKEANIMLKTAQEDSTKLISAVASQIDANGLAKPAENVDVTFYVKRLFGLLPLGDEATVTTDKNGIATITFPNNIKGDSDGNVVIIARIEYNDTFGNVETEKVAKFGLPLIPEKAPSRRTMWESKAPVWMLIGFYSALSGIWIALFYVMSQLYKIKRERIA